MSKMILTESELKNIIYNSVERILNEIKSDTFLSAANVAGFRGQYERRTDFLDAFLSRRNQELEEIFGSDKATTLNGNQISFTIDGNSEFVYNINEDEFTYKGQSVPAGSRKLRSNDRRFVRGILEFFNRFKPDSQYNHKDMWIA
jgi:hypothetical protein